MKPLYNSGVVYLCKYRVVWCPKYCRKVLVDEVASRLETLIAEVCSSENIDIFEISIAPNSVNLLIGVAPQLGVHRAVKLIKAHTSHVLRREFLYLNSKLPTLWSNSYFLSTVGNSPISAIEEYIESQKS